MSSGLRWVLLAAIVLIVALTMIAIWTFPQPAEATRAGVMGTAGQLAGNIELLASEAASPVLDRLGLAGSARPAAGADIELPGPPRRPAARQEPEIEPPPTPVVFTEPSLLASADPLPGLELPPPNTIEDRPYVAGDPGLTPARPLYPLFPSQPPAGADPNRVGVVDLIVNEFGGVDVVTLVRGPRDVLDSMVLPAIKAWRFEPAMKDGRPVKFRHRILLTY